MKKLIGFSFLIAALAGCTANQVNIDAASLNVQIGTTPPNGSVVQLGPVTARHGGGCGLYGSEGNFEGAATILRNKAAAMGANYVQIIQQQGEHMTGLCLDRGYTIDAMTYHITVESRTPVKP